MAQTQVTYTDKVENSGATNDGKVRAVDMNELKTVVNDNATDTGDRLGNIEGSEIKIGTNAGATSQGTNSVAVGKNSGQTSMGSNSVAIGSNAGATSLGDQSTALGNQAGQTSTGDFITAVGSQAGKIATGARGSFFGLKAGDLTTTETNVTCLGQESQITGTNQVQLGNSGTTTYAYGAVQDRSDERDKADVEDIHLGLDFIDALTPRSYKFDYREDYRVHQEDAEGNIIPDTRELGEITHDGTRKRSRLHCGLVAQEVKQVMDDLGVDFGGYQDHSINGGQDVLSIGYGELIAPMIKAIQELKAEIDILKGQ